MPAKKKKTPSRPAKRSGSAKSSGAEKPAGTAATTVARRTRKPPAKPRAATAKSKPAKAKASSAQPTNGQAKPKTPRKSANTKRKRSAHTPDPQPLTPSPCSPTPDSRPLTPDSDRELVDRALAGQPGAWDDLYFRCHQPLLAAIRAIIANRTVDPNLVDELAARVWYAVVRDEGRLLDRFDPGRGCTLTT